MDELTKQQAKTLHQKLLDQQKSLIESLNMNKETSRPVQLDQQALGRVSRIDAIQQQKMAFANRNTQELTLKQTAKALRRIEEEEYGYCEQCDNLIRYERLLIKPETIFCIQCQSAQEAH